jgi:GNAT superfamily N-acetyltransferase
MLGVGNYNVVTHKDHRNRGNGQAVVKAALELAWAQNAHQVLVFSARADANVQTFYEKCGFENGRKAGYVILNPKNE